jgi:Ca2+-transporting ATPase
LKAVHGRELADLNDEGWKGIVHEAAVFARVSPEHKLRIVEALQQQHEIVAMTGDGVNDAPALKAADIGVAMGVKGTEVAKEASAMIITDDNFATIVGAVEQGRLIYSNIIRFIHYLFSCNFSEILTVFIPILVGWPLPLVALQILWLNMITDVFPAMALALEPTAPGLMKRPPRDPRVPLLNRAFVWTIVWQATLLASFTLLSFYVAMQWYGDSGPGLNTATTVAFMTLALAQVVHVFSARSQSRSAVLSGLFSNAWIWASVVVCILLQLLAVYWGPLNRILRTSPLSWNDWLLVTGCSVAPAIIIEVLKFSQHLLGEKK